MVDTPNILTSKAPLKILIDIKIGNLFGKHSDEI